MGTCSAVYERLRQRPSVAARVASTLVVMAGLAAAGCSDGGALGTERNGCRPDKSCEIGLVCLSNLCVDPGSGGDTGGAMDALDDTTDTLTVDTGRDGVDSIDAIDAVDAVDSTVDSRPEPNLPEGPFYTVVDGCGRPAELTYPDCAGVTCGDGQRCMGAGLCLPTAAVALPSFVGSQSSPSLAVRDDGAWGVAYFSGTIPDGVMHVWVQVFASGGLVGSSPLMLDDEFTPRFNRTPSIAVLDNGSWIVVWRAEATDTSDGLVFRGRVVSPDGSSAIGPSFAVSETPFKNGGGSTNVDAPVALTLRKGGVLVAWPAQALDSNVSGVYARRIGGQGGLLGREIDIGAVVPGLEALSPSIAPLPSGGAVILWQSQDLSGDSKEVPDPPVTVRGRRIDPVGLPAGEVFSVTSSAYPYEAVPNATALDDTRLLIAWKTSAVSSVTSAVDVRARLFALTPSSIAIAGGTEHALGRDPSGILPDQAATITLVRDRALVAWHSAAIEVNGVFARRYYPAEDVFDCEATVLSEGTNPVAPALPSAVAFRDGRILVAWNNGAPPNTKTFLRFLPY